MATPCLTQQGDGVAIIAQQVSENGVMEACAKKLSVIRGSEDGEAELALAVTFTIGNTRFVGVRMAGSLLFHDAKTGRPEKEVVNN